LVAEEYGRGNTEGIQSYVTTALWTLAVTGCIAMVVLILLAKPIIGLFKLGPENVALAEHFLPYMGILTVYAFLIQILTATLSGLGRMDQANYRDSACRAISLGVAAVLLIFGYGIVSLLIGSAINCLLLHITSILLIRRIMNLQILALHWDVKRFRKLISFGGEVFGGSIISMLFSPFNKLMLSRYAGVSTVPIYEIAYTGSMQVRVLFEAALRPLMPEISRLAGKGTLSLVERIRHINKRAMMLIIGGGLPLYVVLFAASTLLTRLWLGGQFSDNIPSAFRLMLIVTFLSLLGVPAYYTLLGLGLARCSLVSAIIITGGNFILVLITLLAERTVSVNSIFGGLIFVSAISVIYLMNQASKEIKALLVDCHRL
jgi:O-antigen/teichoic acid export membrane protein